MATECTQEAILDFLTEQGGRVKNTDLVGFFKPIFPDDVEKKAEVREKFKNYVDNVAFVKMEQGIKFVCLKKKYRCRAEWAESTTCGSVPGQETGGGQPGVSHGTDTSPLPISHCVEGVCLSEGEVKLQPSPISGYGNDIQVRDQQQPRFSGAILAVRTSEVSRPDFTCIVEEVTDPPDMGNIVGFRGHGERKSVSRGCSVRTTHEPEQDIPSIAVIEASPLPAPEDGSMFKLPEYATNPVNSDHGGSFIGLSPGDADDRGVESESVVLDLSQGSHMVSQSKEHEVATHDAVDEGQYDSHSLSGSEDNVTPRGSRKNFIVSMMDSSPQVRRSMVQRNSIYLSARYRDSARSDSDTASVVSSNPDEDGAAITLDPLEHEWMMCASDGEWASLHSLLTSEPGLVLKKDFITGFTCLHWAAKQGKPELLALIVNFAKQHAVPVNINARSSAGYTPLHLAAMHNHLDVVKLLVGAYDADVEIRDYSGKKACQYLPNSVTVDIQDIVGAYGDSDSESTDAGDGGRWRLSRVLHSNLKPLKLFHHGDHQDSLDGDDRPRHKVVRRRSSLSKMKPKLQNLRWRTSQIVHSVSFREPSELEGSLRASFKSRPKTTLLG